MTCKTCKHREDCDLFLRSGCDTSVGALFDCAEYVFDDEYDKGLEVLKNLKEQNKTHRWLEQQFENEWLDTIEKELKALEIIKENKIEGLTLEWDGTWWTICVPNYPFPIAYGRKKEEYDLLKEVLS